MVLPRRFATSFTSPVLKSYLDNGIPVVLGLVKVGPTNLPVGLTDNHQVLAFGYREGSSAKEVFIYDPNYPAVVTPILTDSAPISVTRNHFSHVCSVLPLFFCAPGRSYTDTLYRLGISSPDPAGMVTLTITDSGERSITRNHYSQFCTFFPVFVCAPGDTYTERINPFHITESISYPRSPYSSEITEDTGERVRGFFVIEGLPYALPLVPPPHYIYPSLMLLN